MVKIITANSLILKEIRKLTLMIMLQLGPQAKFKQKLTDQTPNPDKLMVSINLRSLKIDQSF